MEKILSLDKETQEFVKDLTNTIAEQAVTKVLKQQAKKRHKNNKLYNTSLLLRNYNNFKKHIETTYFEDEEIAITDLLKKNDEVLDETDSLFIESILRTKKRTKIMLNHIDNCLELYKIKCEQNEKIYRKYKVIMFLYIEQSENGENYTIEDVANILGISTKTVDRDKEEAIKELSIFLFGIDALLN